MSGGLRFFRRASDGSIILASKHPVGCPTWHWSISIKRRGIHTNRTFWFVIRAEHRSHQWHDYYRLPFGWTLIVSRQDYHKARAF